jgi:hypothetical protein
VPCYRCGARQTDPVRGASPWRKGVRADEQVLVCPDCQRASDWTVELDRCGRCGSTALVRRLGRTACRDCEVAQVAGRSPVGIGTVPVGLADDEAEDRRPPGHRGTDTSDLAHEVAAAIDRVLGRTV